MIVLPIGAVGSPRRHIVVGKAITFDTGGISIKPSASMEEMKFDKMGGCAVLGIMRAVRYSSSRSISSGSSVSGEHAQRNRISAGRHPHFVLGEDDRDHQYDAEGRLILADALTYACEQIQGGHRPATLTGACVVALGHRLSASATSAWWSA